MQCCSRHPCHFDANLWLSVSLDCYAEKECHPLSLVLTGFCALGSQIQLWKSLAHLLHLKLELTRSNEQCVPNPGRLMRAPSTTWECRNYPPSLAWSRFIWPLHPGCWNHRWKWNPRHWIMPPLLLGISSQVMGHRQWHGVRAIHACLLSPEWCNRGSKIMAMQLYNTKHKTKAN